MERLAFQKRRDLAFPGFTCSSWEKKSWSWNGGSWCPHILMTKKKKTPCVLRPHHPTSPLMHAINKQIERENNLLRNARCLTAGISQTRRISSQDQDTKKHVTPSFFFPFRLEANANDEGLIARNPSKVCPPSGRYRKDPIGGSYVASRR